MNAVDVIQPPRITGAPGYSAYQLAVQGGYAGTQAQWLASLVGPPADTTALNTAVANAGTSATSAANSATAAYNSAGASAISAQAAASSATTAGNSVTAAANHAADAGTSATAALNSANASVGSATNSANSATLAQAWAMQTSGTVDGTSYSARWYAQLAASWASQATGTVDGTNLSAKQYALQAAQSAAQAAGAGITPTGSFAVGDFLVAGSTTGGSAKSGGAPAAVATSGSASDLTKGTLPAAQLPAHGVANGNLAQMPAGTVKANLTGALADSADVTPSAVLDSFSSTQGTILVRGAAAWIAVGPGTAGQVFTSGGAGKTPGYAAPTATYPITGTSPKTAAYTLDSTAGDTGNIFDLTGSFALTLPAASGGSTTAPLYYHYRKRDGSGSCTLVLSGSDTWEDGTTAPKFIYQETGTVVSIGGGVWRFAPGTRQRGRVFAGTYAVAAGASAIAITLGFGDPDAQNVVVEVAALALSTSAYVGYGFTQGGAAATIAGFTAASSSVGYLTSNANAGPVAGSLAVRNVRSTAANGVSVQNAGISGSTASNGGAFVTSAGAITQLSLTPSAGTFTGGSTGGSYSVWIDRP